MSTNKETQKTKKKLTEAQVERRNARRDFLRGLIAPLVIIGVVVLAVFLILRFQKTDEGARVIEIYSYDGEGEEIVLENDALKLTMDGSTTQFELLVKSTGKVWYSNAQDTDSDPIALSSEKNRLQAPVALTYSNVSGLEASLNAYANSALNGTYEIEADADSITVRYSIGDIQKEYVVPPVLLAEEYTYWHDLMDSGTRSLLEQYYKKYDIGNLGRKDDPEELLARYPILETEVIYTLRDTVLENQLKRLQKAFEEAGYTYEQYAEAKELDLAEQESDKPVYNVTVVYRLEGGDLVVELPMSEVDCREDYPLYTLSILPFFGAAGTDEDGFLFVPEGGGALIRFNNGRTSQNAYYANLYGWDLALSRKSLVHNTRVYYNTFGVSEGNDSFLCILEDGRAYASVRADIAGKTNSYNYVDAVYSMFVREQYEVSGLTQSDVYEYLWELPDETIRQRYRFLGSGDYVDMAKAYGAYLQDTYGDALAMNGTESAPVAVEIVGAIDKVKQIVGVPVSRPLPLTSYEDAEEMIRDLDAAGMENLSVRLTGWCNGGINQKLLKRVHLISALGSRKDFRSLIAAAEELGDTIYLDGTTMYAYDSNLWNGFFSFRDAARFISKERAELYQYSHVTYSAREFADSYYLLHTALAGRMADNLQSYADGSGAGVSFADIGKDLAADYYRKDPTSRQATLELHQARLKSLYESGEPVMTPMGNEYTAVYSDLVTYMDLRGSEYTILDEYIPFYEIAIHGRVDYTGESINLCGNAEEEVLICAEYGAGLYFTFMKASAFETQKTLYTELYGASYESWRDRAVEIYGRYNAELGHTFAQEMTGHRNLENGVTCTEYADGTKVYVNYEFSDARVDGVTVPARDYLVVR